MATDPTNAMPSSPRRKATGGRVTAVLARLAHVVASQADAAATLQHSEAHTPHLLAKMVVTMTEPHQSAVDSLWKKARESHSTVAETMAHFGDRYGRLVKTTFGTRRDFWGFKAGRVQTQALEEILTTCQRESAAFDRARAVLVKTLAAMTLEPCATGLCKYVGDQATLKSAVNQMLYHPATFRVVVVPTSTALHIYVGADCLNNQFPYRTFAHLPAFELLTNPAQWPIRATPSSTEARARRPKSKPRKTTATPKPRSAGRKQPIAAH